MRPEGTKYVILQNARDRFAVTKVVVGGGLQPVGKDAIRTLEEAEAELAKQVAVEKFRAVARYYDDEGQFISQKETAA